MTYMAVEQARERSPADWPWLPFRRVARLRREVNAARTETLLSLSADRGVEARPEGGGRQLASVATESSYWVVHPNDLVFNPMWAIEGGVAVSAIRGAVSTAYRVYEMSDEVHPRYLHHYLRSRLALEQYRALVRGVTTFDRSVTREDLDDMPVPLPSVSEQRAIADYLDTETARIDALIARKQSLSTTLDSRWRRQLLQLLRASDAPGSDPSPWISKSLPEGWVVRPLRRLIAQSWGGDWGGEPGTALGDLDCVRAADFDFATLQAVEGARRSFDANTLKSRVLRVGDMVVEKSGGGEGVPVGRVVAWRGDGAAVPTNFAAGLRPAADADSDFVLLVLRAAYEVGLPWRSIKQTTGLQNLDLGHYLTHHWPVPVLQEQRRVAAELMGSLQQVRALQKKLNEQVRLLREHRQALITAAVTGELEIPGVAS